jgi:arginyl-tRNA--protein-N-Asp/Glu arginylyltransferase
MSESLQLAITDIHPCNYLTDAEERLVFTLPEQPLSPELYLQLMRYNFRRSSAQLYRPYCPECQACQSVRLASMEFLLSTSQKRQLNRAQKSGWHWRWQQSPTASVYFELYQRYITARHADGVMFPADISHLQQLLDCTWLQVSVFEHYIGDRLVGAMILDHVPDGISLVYSFFEPDTEFSLGTLAVLGAHQLCLQQQWDFLYLGYWVDGSPKMAYKSKFRPQQRLSTGIWQSFT